MWPIIQKLAPAETWRGRGHSTTPDLRRKPGFDASALRAPPRGDLIQKSSPGPVANDAAVRVPQNLPSEIAFLVHYGIASGVLLAAAATARVQGVTGDAVLLAEGTVSEDHFYGSLARYLRLPFVADVSVRLAAAIDYPQCVKAGIVPLAGLDRTTFVIAPRGRAIGELITTLRRNASAALVVTTPTHLAELVHAAARREISQRASLGLWSLDPWLCAKGGAGRGQSVAALIVVGAIAAFLMRAPGATATVCKMMLSLAFLAVIWLRLAACAASREVPALPPPFFDDAKLPIYSIVIALYREARVVPQLLAALDALDYPALGSKLT